MTDLLRDSSLDWCNIVDFYPVFWFVVKDAINAIFLKEESEGGLHKDSLKRNKLRIKTNNYWQVNCWCDKSSFWKLGALIKGVHVQVGGALPVLTLFLWLSS